VEKTDPRESPERRYPRLTRFKASADNSSTRPMVDFAVMLGSVTKTPDKARLA
jgi:hypothetical protein